MGEAGVEQPFAGSSVAALRAQAHAAHQANQLDSAELLYKRLLAADCTGEDAANLGALLRQQGRLAEALAVYSTALSQGAAHLSLISNAANAFRQAGEYQASAEILRSGLQQSPGDPALLQGLAKTLLVQGEPAQALACLQPLQQQGDPSHELCFDLGVACSRLGDLEAALRWFDQAAQMEPAHLATAANRITLSKELGQLAAARLVLQQAKASALAGDELQAAEAGLLMAEQEMAAAALLFHQLCERQPLDLYHWLNLAAALRALKRASLPARVVKAGLSLNPANPELQQALFQALAELGALLQAAVVLQQSDRSRLVEKDSHFFNLQFLATGYGLLSAAEQQQLAALWEQRKQQAAGDSVRLWQDYLSEPIAGRRLRVGYLSSDFCNHPVSRFLLPVLQSHDKRVVEVWGLHTGPHWDAVSEQLQQTCEHWLDLQGCTDQQAARVISDQRLDVLVELGGYTGNSRVGICVHGAAPLQVSYLGYPGATFLAAVPGWVGDCTLFAHLSAAERSHTLLELEGGYMCFPRPLQAPQPERLAGPRFRFGSFNHARKLTDATLQLWGALLRQAPAAQLVLKSISFLEEEEQQRIRGRCEQAGMAADQLMILPWAEDLACHLEQYSQLDVALDPIPYGGATTTAEALWMGVPVVCLHGPGMVGSLSASLLQSAGQPQWVAQSEAEYQALALQLMDEGIRGQAQRQQLCSALEASALNQPRRVSSQLESLFRQALFGEGREA